MQFCIPTTCKCTASCRPQLVQWRILYNATAKYTNSRYEYEKISLTCCKSWCSSKVRLNSYDELNLIPDNRSVMINVNVIPLIGMPQTKFLFSKLWQNITVVSIITILLNLINRQVHMNIIEKMIFMWTCRIIHYLFWNIKDTWNRFT